MKKEPVFELIVDGEAVEDVVGFNALENVEKEFNETMKKLGYNEFYCEKGGSHNMKLFFNKKNCKSIVTAWREKSGFVDKNGETIYYGDMVKKDDECFFLNEYPDGFKHSTDFYLRNENEMNEIPITKNEIKKDYTVIHCIYPEVYNKKTKTK